MNSWNHNKLTTPSWETKFEIWILKLPHSNQKCIQLSINTSNLKATLKMLKMKKKEVNKVIKSCLRSLINCKVRIHLIWMRLRSFIVKWRKSKMRKMNWDYIVTINQMKLTNSKNKFKNFKVLKFSVIIILALVYELNGSSLRLPTHNLQHF